MKVGREQIPRRSSLSAALKPDHRTFQATTSFPLAHYGLRISLFGAVTCSAHRHPRQPDLYLGSAGTDRRARADCRCHSLSILGIPIQVLSICEAKPLESMARGESTSVWSVQQRFRRRLPGDRGPQDGPSVPFDSTTIPFSSKVARRLDRLDGRFPVLPCSLVWILFPTAGLLAQRADYHRSQTNRTSS